jgi:ATP-grasp domain
LVERAPLLAEVERRLGDRRLVWAGIRGDDIEPLSDLPQLYGSFSLAGSYTKRGGIQSVAYEDLTGVRVDPEVWDIDERPKDSATIEFRQGLLRALGSNSALLPYRPSQFLSAVHFARQRECLNLGLFGAQQAAFEHKPWVETAVSDMGLPRIPWSYVADEEQLKARELSRQGSVVLRRSRTSGGQGFTHVESPEQLAAAWPAVDEAFVSVAPFLDGGTPVNVGATVWRDGVTVHHPSIQLVGIESCVTREFGYCGNDFGLVRDLDPVIIDQIEASTIVIGKWLLRHGYLGGFGVDFLIYDGVPLFTEVNPRFQGSTHASCRLSIEAGDACLMLEHVAAWLGISCPGGIPLRRLVSDTPDFANVVVHWTGYDTQSVEANQLEKLLRQAEHSTRSDVLTPARVRNDTGSAVARFTMRRRVTTTGFDLEQSIDDVISQWQRDTRSAYVLEERI